MVKLRNRYERKMYKRNAIARALRSPALAQQIVPKKTKDDWNYDDYLREANEEAQDDFGITSLRGPDGLPEGSVDD